MVKCAVSGCPNRTANVNRGVLRREPKRFFSFPSDPARVKVWLAALRETDEQDSTEQRLICEDHFLPEDVSAKVVNGDAIPIMPPYLDGPLGLTGPWGAESSEEEGAAGGCQEDGDEGGDGGGHEGGHDGPPVQKDPGQGLESAPGPERTSVSQQLKKPPTQKMRPSRADVSLGVLTLRFLELLLAAPDGSVDVGDVAAGLQTRRRRVCDITDTLNGIDLIRKEQPSRITWTGTCPISSFLWRDQQKFQRELENLKLVEDTLDGLIRSCAQQLFAMTDDVDNSATAYVTHQDVSRLPGLQNQTLILVRAPEETRLEVPAPREDGIQIHLKTGRGPIVVLTCEEDSGDATTSDTRKNSCVFVSVEDSRIRTSPLVPESSGPSAVQSA